MQTLLRLDPAQTEHVLPPRSACCSDAFSAGSRLALLEETLTVLNGKAGATLPDRLTAIPGLGLRGVGAVDGTYQHERGFASDQRVMG